MTNENRQALNLRSSARCIPRARRTRSAARLCKWAFVPSTIRSTRRLSAIVYMRLVAARHSTFERSSSGVMLIVIHKVPP